MDIRKIIFKEKETALVTKNFETMFKHFFRFLLQAKISLSENDSENTRDCCAYATYQIG